jgi:hypothetical protein
MIEVTELNRIKREAAELLKRLAHADQFHLIAALKPQDEDYAKVFVGDAVALAKLNYGSLWMDPPTLAKPTQTEVETFALQAETLQTDNEFRDEFPGGYRKIAHHLNPELVWVIFKFTEPGKTTGMAYDGLVYLDGRWAWFPKPWRYLVAPIDN